MKILLLVLGLLAYSIPQLVSGQIATVPGYIISNTGDTLRGKVEYVNTNLSAKRAFIPENSPGIVFLKPEQMQQLYVNNEIHFKKHNLNKKPVLIQVISEGQINLYRYKGGLYLKTDSDNLMLLTGGKKTVTENDRKYAIIDFTYKSQLRKVLQTDAFNPRIDRLEYNDAAITRFVQEVNQRPEITYPLSISKQNQFGLQTGFSRISLKIKKTQYNENHLHSTTSMLQGSTYYERQWLSSATLGGYYRRKAGKKYSYLKAGFLFEKVFETTKTESRNLYRSFLSTSSGTEPYDLAGYIKDRYKFDFTAIHVPISYQAELSDGRFRPYLDLGVNTRILVKNNNTVNREVHITDLPVTQKETQIYMKPFTLGPLLGAGGRFLFPNNTSLATGVQFDAVFSENLVNPNAEKLHTLLFYLSFGF